MNADRREERDAEERFGFVNAFILVRPFLLGLFFLPAPLGGGRECGRRSDGERGKHYKCPEESAVFTHELPHVRGLARVRGGSRKRRATLIG